jgi:phosphoribosylformylglycinamidine cyclo-ligase
LSVGELILSPTRTYLPVISEILKNHHADINGMIHCTGGGQTKVTKFVENVHIIKDNLLEIPPIFQLIQEEAKTDGREMYQVFNMGHRLEIYTNEAAAQEMIKIGEQFGIKTQIIGRVEPFENGNKLTIKSPIGTYEY